MLKSQLERQRKPPSLRNNCSYIQMFTNTFTCLIVYLILVWHFAKFIGEDPKNLP